MLTRLLLFVLLCLPVALNQKSAAQACNPGNTDPSVTICMPQSDATQSPIHLQIATNDSAKVDMLQVWYNGVKRWEDPVSSADFFLPAEGTGPYKITALAHDVSGRWFQASVAINITDQFFGCASEQTMGQGPRSVVICSPADGEIHFSRSFWHGTPLLHLASNRSQFRFSSMARACSRLRQRCRVGFRCRKSIFRCLLPGIAFLFRDTTLKAPSSRRFI